VAHGAPVGVCRSTYRDEEAAVSVMVEILSSGTVAVCVTPLGQRIVSD
jgi:hypothetical protein